MATDLFLELAELPATGSLGTGQSDTRDLVVAGVRISISPKNLYLYLALKVLTLATSRFPKTAVQNGAVLPLTVYGRFPLHRNYTRQKRAKTVNRETGGLVNRTVTE